MVAASLHSWCKNPDLACIKTLDPQKWHESATIGHHVKYLVFSRPLARISPVGDDSAGLMLLKCFTENLNHLVRRPALNVTSLRNLIVE